MALKRSRVSPEMQLYNEAQLWEVRESAAVGSARERARCDRVCAWQARSLAGLGRFGGAAGSDWGLPARSKSFSRATITTRRFAATLVMALCIAACRSNSERKAEEKNSVSLSMTPPIS
jgi:hypothetical protein